MFSFCFFYALCLFFTWNFSLCWCC